MITWLKKLLFAIDKGDLSQHRVHTTKYEDLCM